jgi:cell wall-associated NlpC family hydrolase
MLLSLFLPDLRREAVRAALGLAVAIGIALTFAGATAAALLAAAAGLRPPPVVAPRGQPDALDPAGRSDVVAVARRYLGMPYVWGGASPDTSFDCSGLVQWSYGQVGVRLPRTAQQQYGATARLEPAELRPGDLVFFANTYVSPDPREWVTHVGIYAGDGLMISAPVEGKPISVQPVFSGFWGAHYAGAGRPTGPP